MQRSTFPGPRLQFRHAQLGPAAHVPGVLVEANAGRAAVLVQHLLPETAPGSVVLGDDVVSGGFTSGD